MVRFEIAEVVYSLPGCLKGGVMVLRGAARGGRTPPRTPYNVLWCERVTVAGDEFDWFVSEGRRHSHAAVYHHWSQRFLECLSLPLLAEQEGGRLGWTEAIMSWLEKSRPKKGEAARTAAAKCAWLAKQCPALHEYLTVSVLPDGDVRQVSTLTIFTEGGLFKACLSERDAEVALFGSGEGLEACLDNLEERLTADVVDWRRKGGGGRGGALRRS